MVPLDFNPSTLEAGAGRSLSSKPAGVTLQELVPKPPPQKVTILGEGFVGGDLGSTGREK